jgi:hypothetical protein
LEDAGQLDHISKMNSFVRKRDLTKLSWAGKYFQGFGELLHNIIGRDGVDFSGAKLWNPEEIS